MASSSVTRSMFLILPLLVILSITPFSSSLSPSDKATKELVHQLCAKPTLSSHFCISWLEFDSTTYTLDLKGLVDLVLKKTQAFGYKNLEMFKGLQSLTPDPTLKASYGNCVTDYELAIAAIENAQGLAGSRFHLLASQAAYKAYVNVASCEGWLSIRTNLPAYVPKRNMLIRRMCNIGSVFSNALAS